MRKCGLPALILAQALLLTPASSFGAKAADDGARAPQAGTIVKAPQPFTDDDLLLFQVTSGEFQLSDGLGAYSSRAGLFLPLGELSRLLDLAIEIDPQRQRAGGWALSETRRVLVDIPAGKAQVGDISLALTPSDAVYRDGEIYLRSTVLEQLLPLKLKASTSALTLVVTPTEPLPFQERLARESARSKLAGSRGGQPIEMVVKTPYRLLSEPTVDVNLVTSAGSQAPRQTTKYDLRVSGDLGGAGVQLFAGSDTSGRLSGLRVLAERKDPEGRIAGPFGAQRSDIGDTFTPALSLGARSVSGRGVAISSAPLEQASVFNRIDLRGELPLGYEVELYVNEVLRASQAQPIQGRYEFTEVNLSYGLNVIRLVFYGPRGERREEVKRLNVGGGQLAKGQFTYSFGAVQQQLSVFQVGAQAAAPGVGDWRVVGGMAYGLSNSTTLTGGVARYWVAPGDIRWVGTGGVATSMGPAALLLDVGGDDHGGSAVSMGVAGRLKGASVTLRHAEYAGGFLDELQSGASASSPLQRSTSLFGDTMITLGKLSVPLSLQLQRNQFVDGRETIQGSARLSQTLRNVLVSSSWVYGHDSGGTIGDRIDGTLDASTYLPGRWQVRGSLAYAVQPDAKLTSVALTGDHNTSEFSALHLGVMHNFDSRTSQFQAAQTWRTRAADISLTSSYDTGTKDLRVGLQLSFGFAFDPLDHRYRAAGPAVAAGGAVAMDAFVDENGNGRRDPGERPLTGLGIRGGRYPATTDDGGHALVTHLGDGASAVLEIDQDTLGDPYLITPAARIRIVPRPGRVAVAAYPVTSAGEVELHMMFRRDGGVAQGLSALQVELVDAGGKVAAQGRTEYDGTAILEGVKAGVYSLRLQSEQAERLKMRLEAPVTVTIPKAGGFAGRLTAVVVQRAAEAEASPGPTSPDAIPATPGPAVGEAPRIDKPTASSTSKVHHHRAHRARGRHRLAARRTQATMACMRSPPHNPGSIASAAHPCGGLISSTLIRKVIA